MTDQAENPTLPVDGNAPAIPEDTLVESEASTAVDAAETTESGDDSNTDDSKHDAKAEADKAHRKAQRRIDRLIAERAQAHERIRSLEAAEEARARAAEQDDEGKPAADPREIARQMRIVEKTAEATAKVMKDAKAKFPDFEQAIAELVEEIGPQIDQVGRPSALIDAVLDSDRSAELLHYLGKNTEIAAELVNLSPARLGRRIAAIESELAMKATPKPSGAAKPLTPVKPSAPVTVDPTKLTDKQWAELRRQERMRA